MATAHQQNRYLDDGIVDSLKMMDISRISPVVSSSHTYCPADWSQMNPTKYHSPRLAGTPASPYWFFFFLFSYSSSTRVENMDYWADVGNSSMVSPSPSLFKIEKHIPHATKAPTRTHFNNKSKPKCKIHIHTLVTPSHVLLVHKPF